MVRFDKLGDDISKNPQFSKFGQARAAYLAALIGLCAGAGLMLAVFGSRELMLFGLFLHGGSGEHFGVAPGNTSWEVTTLIRAVFGFFVLYKHGPTPKSTTTER